MTLKNIQTKLKKFYSHSNFNIVIHIIFWIVFFLLPHLFFFLPYTVNILLFRALEVFIFASLFYLNAYFLIPKFLIKKKYLVYFLIIFIISGTFIHFLPQAKYKFSKPNIEYIETHSHIDVPREVYRRPKPHHIGFLMMTVFAISTAHGYALIIKKREQENIKLINETSKAELSFLKWQINPHFLFNVLNSMYSLSIKKSDKVPEVILTLSDLLRYMTYEAKDNEVPLKNELLYISNYIKLQKLRMQNPDSIIYTTNINDESKKIAPLILITFIENAFKHGILSNGTSEIAISINQTNTELLFTCSNSYAETTAKDSSHGIGIANAKRRLEIIYKNAYQLNINKEINTFNVSLSIQLSS